LPKTWTFVGDFSTRAGRSRSSQKPSLRTSREFRVRGPHERWCVRTTSAHCDLRHGRQGDSAVFSCHWQPLCWVCVTSLSRPCRLGALAHNAVEWVWLRAGCGCKSMPAAGKTTHVRRLVDAEHGAV
jgi:hypothetical protein